MPRFLINTTLAPDHLAEAIGKLGIGMEAVAPPREMPSHRLVDVNLTPELTMSSTALRAAVMAIDGVDQALPVPDAEPG